jgi:hypothetical protein
VSRRPEFQLPTYFRNRPALFGFVIWSPRPVVAISNVHKNKRAPYPRSSLMLSPSSSPPTLLAHPSVCFRLPISIISHNASFCPHSHGRCRCWNFQLKRPYVSRPFGTLDLSPRHRRPFHHWYCCNLHAQGPRTTEQQPHNR